MGFAYEDRQFDRAVGAARRRHSAHASGPAACAGAPGPSPGDLGAILRLQRAVGNWAVSSLLEAADAEPLRSEVAAEQRIELQRVSGKKTPTARLAELRKRGLVTSHSTLRIPIKTSPKHAAKYDRHTHDHRTYHYAVDARNRTTKISGPLTYTKAVRMATAKVANKRKDDQSGHLIAHSLGGPPRLTNNYVAMDRRINGAGGDWGKVEGYVRTRLQQKGKKVWMAIVPSYPTATMGRPHHIDVRPRFNRSPYKVELAVPTL